jgi:hypothetical protein
MQTVVRSAFLFACGTASVAIAAACSDSSAVALAVEPDASASAPTLTPAPPGPAGDAGVQDAADVLSSLRDISPIDFFIQNVCLGGDGQVVPGASPLDARCVSTRDLAPGEALPYHKIEYPGASVADDLASQPSNAFWKKVTRFDAIPAATVLGLGGVSVSDNADGAGNFWNYETGRDTIHGPYLPSANSVWVAFGIDHSGPYRNISTNCTGDMTDPESPKDGNVLVPLLDGKFSGLTVGSFQPLPTTNIDHAGPCPTFRANPGAEVVWEFRMLRYGTGLKKVQDLTPPLLTLYTTNGKTAASSHSEPTYYTREHGQIRHESWDNLDHPDWQDPDVRANLQKLNQQIKDEHLCDNPAPVPPTAGANWILVSCRQETVTIPSYDPNGDRPDVWLDALKGFELSAPLFGQPLPPAPSIQSMSPTSGPTGTIVTLTGTNFSPSDNTILFGRGCSLNDVASKGTQGAGKVRTITFPFPASCARGKKDAADEVIAVFNGHATSVEDGFVFDLTP